VKLVQQTLSPTLTKTFQTSAFARKDIIRQTMAHASNTLQAAQPLVEQINSSRLSTIMEAHQLLLDAVDVTLKPT
jgi:hypothetical protein